MSEEQELTAEEKAKLDAEYDRIKAAFTEKGHHEICLKVLLLLVDPSDGLRFRDLWTPELAKEWWVMMDEARNDKTYRKALDDQLMLAAYLHQKMDKLNLAAGLLLLIDECVKRWQLVDFDAAQLNEAAAKVAAATAAATGAKPRPVPAKVGEKAPEGALRPDQLGKPRRI